MSHPIHLAFLWRLHQPWYIDPSTDCSLLPWVRLHGIGAYSDMACLLSHHPSIHTTVSFSPSLVDQLERYAAGAQDDYERITMIPAQDLGPDHKQFLLQHFFSINWARVIQAMPRYHELLERRGRDVHPSGWEEAASRFSTQDLRDLQILFNLAWFGVCFQDDPDLVELVNRQRDYTEEDKEIVLHKQREAIQSLLPRWRAHVEKGSVEVACAPYHHAILPLLIDTNTAKRANPEVSLPERFSHPCDAEDQVALGADRVALAFGRRPTGLWPSEGAISPEVIPLVQRCGMRYVATDAEILFHSLDDRGSTPGRNRLSQPYRIGETAVLFRDDQLSRRISREYAAWDDSLAAAQDFVDGVVRVGENARVDGDRPPLVLIALEGENPWEAYPQRGQTFLAALYEMLDVHDRIKTVTLTEHLEAHPPTVGLDYLDSGSWIEANFDIWIGDAEKNRAWNLLGRARNRLERKQLGAELDDSQAKLAREHLLRAECSDWFWWMGEPFTSAEDPIYERLFRSHLLGLYQALGDSPPADLSRPIPHGGIVVPLRQPTAYIHPRVDGSRTSFFEWRGAGFYRVPDGAHIGQAATEITGVYWGFDPGRFFIRLDPAEVQLDTRPLVEGDVWFELTGPNRAVVGRLDLTPPQPLLALTQTKGDVDLGIVEEVAFQDVVEVAIPLSRLGFSPGTRLGLTLHISRDGLSVLDVPKQGVIEVEIPDPELGFG